MDLIKKKLVKVIWRDSATFKEWYNYNEISRLITDDEDVTSVGYLVFEDKIWIVLAQNTDNESCSSITKIPKKSILNLIRLKGVK